MYLPSKAASCHILSLQHPQKFVAVVYSMYTVYVRQYVNHQCTHSISLCYVNVHAALSFFELPFLSTHRTLLIHLLRVEPLHDAVNMEAV